MKRKYKMTGCARFFIVLIILAPLAYLGASYYNGEDGIENIKNLLGIGVANPDVDNDTYTGDLNQLINEIKVKDKRIESLIEETEELKKQVEDQNKEIKHLKQQLESQ
jgi:peptidoglycan hydrolase CwlO-like protein